jgi:nucleoside 2-deoxyribosyltransferase
MRAFYPNPTVFIGRHFDTDSELKFNKLSEFLTQLGFNVKQGEEYSSRDVPGKVKGRIEQQDIIIALISGERNEYQWIGSELTYAHAKGKHVILMIENGLDFNPTIMGTDLEQIRFPKECIEKSL